MRFGNWTLDPSKYLEKQDAMTLLACAKQAASCDATPAESKIAVRDYFVVSLGLNTGLRVMEMAALNCGDLFLAGDVPSVLVRRGKGGKRRVVFFGADFRKHCLEFLAWKESRGESVAPDSPVFWSRASRGHLSRHALQDSFKRSTRRAGLSASYAIHSLRHTYACLLLKASNWNLRLIQKQLGHASILTTQVYADVMIPDIGKAVNRLYK
mgnify:CR=1 FL=1